MFAKLYEQYPETCISMPHAHIPIHPFNSHQNTLWIPLNLFADFKLPCQRVDWDLDTPKKHQTELHTSGWYHAWYPSSKNWDSFVFPQQTLQKTRCHADCYSSSSWLKQIAPVGRSNHRVTHGTLVHYDLGIRGIRVKHPWVKLMGDVFWCQKGPHDSLGMCFKR